MSADSIVTAALEWQLLAANCAHYSRPTGAAGSVDAVNLVHQIPAITTKSWCTHLTNYKGFGITRSQEL
jgi:hypothetical protein